MTESEYSTRGHGAEGAAAQISDEVREALASFLGAVTPLVAQISPGPGAPEATCTWCPLCALVALSKGEQHPLLTALGTQGVALLTALRDLLADSLRNHDAADHDAANYGTTGHGTTGHGAAGHDAASDGAAAGRQAQGGTDDTGAPEEEPARRAPRFEPIAVTVEAPPGEGMT
ncbi:hypothetical protein [Tomitella fengzijianii]|uniref:Uncharacterized protein n=1 Tax=Tomitella fengzijianii TaxID=2597660 RepID=A0A516X495_9ACTN|nr:hypothetical protein [Tomitella fengzijianii]QDQ97887.1 hypothetical protein FO059_11905 [Tomitella fengzijianii]